MMVDRRSRRGEAEAYRVCAGGVMPRVEWTTEVERQRIVDAALGLLERS
jgi:hypothetical protein